MTRFFSPVEVIYLTPPVVFIPVHHVCLSEYHKKETLGRTGPLLVIAQEDVPSSSRYKLIRSKSSWIIIPFHIFKYKKRTWMDRDETINSSASQGEKRCESKKIFRVFLVSVGQRCLKVSPRAFPLLAPPFLRFVGRKINKKEALRLFSNITFTSNIPMSRGRVFLSMETHPRLTFHGIPEKLRSLLFLTPEHEHFFLYLVGRLPLRNRGIRGEEASQRTSYSPAFPPPLIFLFIFMLGCSLSWTDTFLQYVVMPLPLSFCQLARMTFSLEGSRLAADGRPTNHLAQLSACSDAFPPRQGITGPTLSFPFLSFPPLPHHSNLSVYRAQLLPWLIHRINLLSVVGSVAETKLGLFRLYF
ncbi:hypothetical protein VP01_19g1 [Puccinia sorghi]|uniref:Uncharacterized protein n=1 Tax=Puccinia sorghi TaxID=27349 RepID=A0A0L6VBF7_9BASI|nr:hypothetical protein VP01_19g1 [Puccinia sorghi]